MNREDLAASALLALPVAIREARGEEILGTLLDCGRPRVTCPEHGTIQVRLPWAEPLSRFTTRFESWAVDQLSECSVTGAGRLLRTSWDESWGLMARAVARGQAVKEPSAPRHVGVDEKSVGHGQGRRQAHDRARPGPGVPQGQHSATFPFNSWPFSRPYPRRETGSRDPKSGISSRRR